MAKHNELMQDQVETAFKVTYLAVLALHFVTSGEIVQKIFSSIVHTHMVTAQNNLNMHPLINSWLEPKDDFFQSIRKFLKRNWHLFQDNNDLAQAAEDIAENNPNLKRWVQRRQEEAANAKQ